ncbi:MAG: NADH-quinone oxidoreductase subunit L [Candidatus Wallbacteria bacterium]|nr:NADH-quinone oxidoreductase subunit L [Candidatus Wallbacteria bacterium]
MTHSLAIDVALLVLLLPLAAFVIQIFRGRQLPRGGDWVSITAIVLSLVGSCFIAREALSVRNPGWGYRWVFDWFTVGANHIQVGLLIDNVTAVMLVVVCGVSALVHVYSTSYMHGDPKYPRFFAYLSLFSFSMLGLVLSDNLLFLYCFWELVGLSSYFLIGFWSEKPAPADAAKKAFLTNRVGDVGFFLGIMILWTQLGTFGYHDVFAAVAAGKVTGSASLLGLVDVGWLTLAGVCLFCGAVGKSAQFPLHVWLPDAMEGPTPVSALIHAATMVAAGVYMVGRLYPLFTPEALIVIAYTGCITAFFAGTIAITATDIKRVLAYSTVSQLGYMVMGLGVGGYTAGLFHLMTHAWFKACLFLGSGSVIHSLHSQEMPEMGGLRKKMPWTFLTMLVATMALCGVPPLSGFFSKDAILAACLQFGLEHKRHLPLFFVAAAGAAITTFYMFRLIFLTFFGQPRDHHKYDHAHESPAGIVLPLVILAGLSVSAGWGGWFEEMVQKPSLASYAPASHAAAALAGHGVEHGDGGHHSSAHTIAMLASLLAVALGFGLSFLMYYKQAISADAMAERFPTVYRWLKNKYYIDEFYDALIVRPLLAFEEWLARFDLGVIDGIVNWIARATVVVSDIAGRIDFYIVDGLVNWFGDSVLDIGQQVRRIQMGRIQEYLVAAFALTLIFVLTLSLVY